MDPRIVVRSSMPSGPTLTAVADEGPVLVAALAAALVEYRRHAGPGSSDGKPEGVGSSWRSLARWDQLQG